MSDTAVEPVLVGNLKDGEVRGSRFCVGNLPFVSRGTNKPADMRWQRCADIGLHMHFPGPHDACTRHGKEEGRTWQQIRKG